MVISLKIRYFQKELDIFIDDALKNVKIPKSSNPEIIYDEQTNDFSREYQFTQVFGGIKYYKQSLFL